MKIKNEINGDSTEVIPPKEIKGRGQWSKGIEFLLSCISMSVGLGNVRLTFQTILHINLTRSYFIIEGMAVPTHRYVY